MRTNTEVVGRFIADFIGGWMATEWEIVNFAGLDGVVYCERLNGTKTQPDNVDLPCVGVFHLRIGESHCGETALM